jgi:hypothetical protein
MIERKTETEPLKIIATLPPYVDHRQFIINHPSVDGLRLNTIMPIDGKPDKVLSRLWRESSKKVLWIDLKTTDLRITQFAFLPYSFVELNHKIKVDLPTEIRFADCTSKIVEIVNGNKLILNRRPTRVVGKGEPVYIPDPSLEIIDGFFTQNCLDYIEASESHRKHNYMLSFAETGKNVEDLLRLAPKARPILKIESKKGLEFVKNEYPKWRRRARLMAARGDLYDQIGDNKLEMLNALELIIEADPNAICASRILTSLEKDDTVSMGDVSDLELMYRMGYRTFMLSDMICFHEDAFKKAIEIITDFRKRVERE